MAHDLDEHVAEKARLVEAAGLARILSRIVRPFRKNKGRVGRRQTHVLVKPPAVERLVDGVQESVVVYDQPNAFPAVETRWNKHERVGRVMIGCAVLQGPELIDMPLLRRPTGCSPCTSRYPRGSHQQQACDQEQQPLCLTTHLRGR